MSEERQVPGADRTAEEAAAWFARLQGGDAGGGDWLAFESWLQAAPENAAAYERLEAIWAELDGHKAALDEALATAPPLAGQARRPASARRGATRRYWLGAAGGALAAGLAGGVFVFANRLSAPATDAVVYEAPAGQTRAVALADGTRVRLNAGSRIAVRLTGDARRVVMSDAEAVFDVAHDPNRPFLITVGDREVRVVGTEFNLRRRAGKVVLTVRRGVVEVRPAGAEAAAPTRVAVGQQLVHVEASNRTTVSAADPQEAFGWTSGRLVCRDQPLSEVAADIGRRFGTPVRTADAQIAALRFTGVLVLDDEGAVLRRLQALAPVVAERTADGVVLRSRS